MKYFFLFLLTSIFSKADILKGARWQNLMVVVNGYEVQANTEKKFFELVANVLDEEGPLIINSKSTVAKSTLSFEKEDPRECVKHIVAIVMTTNRHAFDTNSHVDRDAMWIHYVDAVMNRYFPTHKINNPA